LTATQNKKIIKKKRKRQRPTATYRNGMFFLKLKKEKKEKKTDSHIHKKWNVFFFENLNKKRKKTEKITDSNHI
jgi:hypothetical protein